MEQEYVAVSQLQSVSQFSLEFQVEEKIKALVDSGAQETIIGPFKIKIGNQWYTKEFHAATIQHEIAKV